MIVTDTYKKVRRRQQKKTFTYGDGRVTTAEACDRLTEAFGRIWRRRRRREEFLKRTGNILEDRDGLTD